VDILKRDGEVESELAKCMMDRDVVVVVVVVEVVIWH
jgi:hypothetical protein